MNTFGDRFRELRLEKGLTQEQLRQEFNKKYHYSFTLSAISQYENNKRIPEINALSDFAIYFNVSIDYLLGKTDIRVIAVTNQISKGKDLETVNILQQAEDAYKVDPEMLIQMCRAIELPEEERKRIKEYSAFIMEKFLREKAEKEKQDDK